MKPLTILITLSALVACDDVSRGALVPNAASRADEPSASVDGGMDISMPEPGAAGSGVSVATRIPATTEDGQCEKFHLSPDRATPDMLIVMDASGSMQTNGRWGASVDAVNTVVADLQNEIRFGLMTFPAGAGAESSCAAGILDVPIDVLNSQPIASTLTNTQPASGLTPTSETLKQARATLAAREPTRVGGLEGIILPQYVMLVTDGDPNCVDVTDLGFLGVQPDPAAQQATVVEVGNLASDGVLTYVIGYDTAGSATATLLDSLAVAGGTGDTQHRSVTSGDELLNEFRSIVAGAVSCSFVLAGEVDFSRVKVSVDGVDANYGTDWSIRDDGHTVDLLGASCDALQVGATVEAEVVCERINII